MYDVLLSDFQIRKGKKRKLRFINFIENRCEDLGLSCRVEEKSGLFYNRNIVVGDINKAHVIFTAHYDTCALMPFPNFITPKNIFFYILYQLFVIGIIIGISYGVAYLATFFISDGYFKLILNLAFLVQLIQIMLGYPNKHTANDNTSGVATLLSLMHRIPIEERNKVAFVFFDNEEVGLIGSSAFKKLHKKELADKLFINFDCVSDGDTFLFVSKKKALSSEEHPLFKQILEENAQIFGRNIEFAKTSHAFYPSDQILFSKSIAVASLKRAPVIGLYIDRVHTLGDTRFDRNNIEYLCSSFTRFVSEIS
jgi:hypothetical protein